MQSKPTKVNRYLPGALVIAVATFVGTDGITPVDPSYVQLTVMDAQRSVACYAYGQAPIQRAGVGAYSMGIGVPRAGSAVGSWFYDWVATGGVQTVNGWSFIVDHDEALGV